MFMRFGSLYHVLHDLDSGECSKRDGGGEGEREEGRKMIELSAVLALQWNLPLGQKKVSCLLRCPYLRDIHVY